MENLLLAACLKDDSPPPHTSTGCKPSAGPAARHPGNKLLVSSAIRSGRSVIWQKLRQAA